MSDEHWIIPRFSEFNVWLGNHSSTFSCSLAGQILPGEPCWLHVSWECWGVWPERPTAENDCLTAAAKCLEILAHGHRTVISTAPQVCIERDFATNRRIVRGCVRFAVSPDEGEWKWAPSPADGSTHVRYLPLPKLREEGG